MTNVVDQQREDPLAELERARALTVGNVPRMPAAPDCSFTLPRGLLVNGAWETEVAVRELTGGDEEALAKAQGMVKFIDGVLTHGTVSVGPMDLQSKPVSERSAILSALLVGERQQLFLKIVEATFGDAKTVGFTCRSCGVDNEVELLLSQDLKSKEVEQPIKTEYTYITSKGQAITLRLAVGADTLEIASKAGMTTSEQNTLLLSRCILKLEGEMVVDPVTYARNLSMKDRQKIIALMDEHDPTVDMEVKLDCTACNTPATLSLGWADIFRP